MKEPRRVNFFTIGILLLALVSACVTQKEISRTEGVAGGAALGGLVGGLIGYAKGEESPIVGSVYGYLYAVGTEKPGYGLYSYVLFPIYSPRAERFLYEFFKTTGYAGDSRVDIAHLNVSYIPARRTSLSMPVRQFATEAYDYTLARQLLAQICTKPSEEVRDTCATDLTRGPYLFSYMQPASTLSTVPPPYLFLDLSRVHERAFGEFVAAYKEQIKRTDYTDRERIDNLRLRLVSIVLTAADWIGPVKGAMADILHMAKEEVNLTK
ncbi:MAG: hypothetical protein GY799_29285 [Desulfobulbaceae bacterium]|nr:hypothetical protein [Desulfobulbaceae bacterium]